MRVAEELRNTMTVLDALNEINGATMREIANLYANEHNIEPDTATRAVKLGLKRGMVAGFVSQQPKGIYTLKGFGNVDGLYSEHRRRRRRKGDNDAGKGAGKKRRRRH